MTFRRPVVVFNATPLGDSPDRAVAACRAHQVTRGVYTTNLTIPLKQVVRAHIWEILAHFVPDALVTDRSAGRGLFEGNALFIVSSARSRDLHFPGL